MAKTGINILKSWFENGDYPNQEQFWAWMDSYWHKDESIDMQSVAGLDTALVQKATIEDIQNVNIRIDEVESNNSAITERLLQNTDLEYILTDSMLLEKIVIVPTDYMYVKIGTTLGGDEIVPLLQLTAMQATVISIDWYAVGDTNIFISGITASAQIIIYKRK